MNGTSILAAVEEHNYQERQRDDLAASISNSLNSYGRYDYEAVSMGTRYNGKMTVIRRNFCLFILFDLLVVSFIWFILEMLTGDGDPLEIFTREVVHYTIESSLFDLVMVAMCRFTILMLFYAVLQLKNKFFVALTTASTCIFLIVKVIYFDWKHAPQGAVEGISFLFSFSLAWGEVWFLDMRVVPLELQAFDAAVRQDFSQQILRNYIDSMGRSYNGFYRRPNQDEFFTPLNEADDGEERILTSEEQEWTSKLMDAERHVALAYHDSQWDTLVTGDICVKISVTSSSTMVFKIDAVINASTAALLTELYENIEYSHSWNSALEECSRFQIINQSYDICYQVMKKIAAVTQRDAVIARKRGTIANMEAVTFMSIEHPNFPPRKFLTRVKCGPSGWMVKEHESDPEQSYLVGIMNVDAKMTWMPAIAMRKFLCTSFVQLVQDMQAMFNAKSSVPENN